MTQWRILPYPPEQPQSNFPPTPSLTQTYPSSSSAQYNRAPIDVLPNDDEGDCSGRTYDSYEVRCKTSKPKSEASSSAKGHPPPSRPGQLCHVGYGRRSVVLRHACLWTAASHPRRVRVRVGRESPPLEFNGTVPGVSIPPYPYARLRRRPRSSFKSACLLNACLRAL